jgi:hypothetical protein
MLPEDSGIRSFYISLEARGTRRMEVQRLDEELQGSDDKYEGRDAD